MSPRQLHTVRANSRLSERAADDLRVAIRRGRLGDSGRLPAESDLSEQLGVSRPTLRQALSILEQDGLLTRRQGVGTFIVEEIKELNNNLNQNFGVTDLIESAGWEAGARETRVEQLAADRTTAHLLGIPLSSRIVCISRTRTANGGPIAYTIDIVAARVFAERGIAEGAVGELLAVEQSLYRLFDRLGIIIHHGVATIRPVSLGEDVAGSMDMKPGALALLLEQVDYTADGEPMVFSKEYHPKDVLTVYRRGPGPNPHRLPEL